MEGTEVEGGTGAGAPRLVGLDGLRGIAVLAVMAFHFGLGWLSGGFFGVDVFFVLSGFLITSLLLQEWTRSTHIALARFWAQRARRLLPGLALVLVAVTLYVEFVAAPASYPAYRGDGLATLFYFSNWHQIAGSTDYFVATGLISPLTHTWSLAIEEQFYLVWPLVMIAILRLVRAVTRATWVLLAVCTAGAVASAAEMALLYAPNASTTRLYFGTDTHAQCILIGAALSCGLSLALQGRWSSIRAVAVSGPLRHAVDAAALLGLASVVVAAHQLSGTSSFTYQGGFLVVAVGTAAVILAAVIVPKGLVSRALSLPPLPWLGRISYGMYLWHFPLAIYLTSARTGLSGSVLAALRLGATVSIAAASFYLIEQPILQRRFWLTARALVPAGVVALAVTGFIVATTEVPGAAASTAPHFRPSAGGTSGTGGTPGTGGPGAGATSTSAPPAYPPPAKVVVLGDSTGLDVSYALRATAPVGTTVVNGAQFGCGLVIGSGISAYPPTFGFLQPPACNAASTPAQQWPALYTQAVAATGPGDLVLFVAGHDDTQGTLINGRWTSIMSPSFRASELARLQQLIAISTAHGAHLDLFTMSCSDINYAFGTPPAPTDSPERRAIYNSLLARAAAADPASVSIVDFGSLICPTGQFTPTLDGVQVRTFDGVHTPTYAPGNRFADNASATVADRFYAWLAPRLWPRIITTVGS